MIQNLLTFIKKYSRQVFNYISTNIFYLRNAVIYIYKLNNWVSFYIYLFDTLQSVTLRVYNKNWNQIFLSLFFSYTIVLMFILMW